MELQIIFSDEVSKYEAIYHQIKEKILTRQLAANANLPAKRKLAAQLNVSIQTVQIAYEQLLSEGYIYSKERAGYYIAPFNPDWHLNIAPPTDDFEIIESKKPFHNFKNGQVDETAFPYSIWLKLYREQLQTHPVTNSPWQGETVLRNEIARYVQVARGIHCHASQVFIFSGTQQQLQMLSNFFGHVQVAMEEPGFFRANAVFQQNAHPIVYVQVDSQGATIPQTNCSLYYVTPAHQYPLGHVMSMERKIQLLQWAKETHCFLIEDDYDSEFRYKGLPIPPLAQMDQLQHVIYFGTFSKTLIPSLRVSYMILPKSLVQAFEQFNKAQKASVSKIDQLIIAQFMENGHYVKHIEKMRTLYRKKHQALLKSLQTYLPHEFKIYGDAAGLHVIIELPAWLTEQTAIALAAEKEIVIDPVSSCYQLSTPTQYVMIGFGAIPIEQIAPLTEKFVKSWLRYKEKAT